MSVANAYAKALYEAAVEAKSSPQELDRIETELRSLVTMVESSKELKVVLYGPLVSAKEKSAVVDSLGQKLGSAKLILDFLKLLARKGRLSLLGDVSKAFYSMRLAAEGGVAGSLVTADPMSPADVEDLAKVFSKKLGKRVAFQVSEDPSLLAGMKVHVNGVTYDGTLRSELQRLRDRLTV